MLRRWVRWCWLVLLLIPWSGLDAEEISFTSQVDSQKIGADETVTLTVTISGANISQTINPEMPEMPDFEVVGTSQSSNISFVNGQFSAKRNIIYTLAPRKLGKLTIPPIVLSYGGTEYRTAPIEVEVIAGSTGKRPQQPGWPFGGSGGGFGPFGEPMARTGRRAPEAVQLIAELDRRQVYQGQQANLTMKVLTQMSITELQVEDYPTLSGFWVEDLQVERNPTGKRVIVNGQQYVEFVVKRNALFASRPGRFTIGAATFAIAVEGDGFFSRGEVVRRKSSPLSLEVLPLPESGRPAGFAGVVGSYSLRAALDRQKVKVGEVATLSLVLSGRGNLKTIQPPSLPALPEFKVYEPKYTEQLSVNGTTIEGEKRWEYVLGPKNKGTYKLDAVELSFFDPDKREYRVARSSPLALEVQEGERGALFGSDRSQLRALREDIAFISTRNDGVRVAAGTPLAAHLWLLLPPLLNVVVFSLVRRQENRRADLAGYLRSRALSQFRKRLKRAHGLANPADAKGFYQEMSTALSEYAAHKLSLSAQGVTLAGVLTQLGERGVPEELNRRFERVWNDVEFGLFAAGKPGVTSMERLMREASESVSELDAVL